MITPSHVIYNIAAATGLTKKLKRKPDIFAIAIGGFLPDIPAFAFFFVQGILLQTPHDQLWDVMYFNSAWTPWLTISHSLILWPLIIAIALYLKRNFIAWLAISSVMHVVVDFFVHTQDAYRNFWPFSEWKFVSPVSYWNPYEYGQIVGTVDTVIVALLLVYLYRKSSNKAWEITLVGFGCVYALIAIASIMRIFE